MLGRYADTFFAKQARERVVAASPNGLAGSMSYPDRELAGTGKIFRTPGYYEMPGPQNAISANATIPGIGGVLPGMGGTLPGMGGTLPGMGQIDPQRLLVWAGVGAAGLMGLMWWQKRQRRALSARRSSRRRSAGRVFRSRIPRDALGRFLPV